MFANEKNRQNAIFVKILTQVNIIICYHSLLEFSKEAIAFEYLPL